MADTTSAAPSRQYLCKAWGETDLSAAALVNDLEGVRAFLAAQWLGDDADSHGAVMADMQEYWETEGDVWSAEFEIGGISVQKVFHAAPAAQPTPPAVVEPLTRYRLLRPEQDRIEAGDEFLSEDTLTWAVDPNGIFVGMIYGGRALRPARRGIKGDSHGLPT